MGDRSGDSVHSGDMRMFAVSRVAVWGVLCLALTWTLPVEAADAAWWNGKWRYRRRVRPRVDTTPRPEVAWAQFSIPEGCAPDGRDVRVVTGGGAEVPSKVMFFDPGIYGIVSFKLQPAGTEYFVYMGNRQAGRPKEWEPKAGVFLTTFKRRGGNGNNWKQMQQMLRRSDRAYGAGYRPRIYEGYNPFGEPDGFVSVYTAWFHVPRAGKYLFATISDDSSFLWVDDKKVAEWPGYHTAHGGRRGEYRGTIELTAGVHKLRYYHVEFRSTQTMVAAWRPAGSRNLETMPASAFVPIASCYVDELEDKRSDIAVDFQFEQLEWLELDGFTYLLYKFHDVSVVPGGEASRREWKFSDGTSYTGDPVEKLFLHPGHERVTLTVTNGGGRKASTTRPILLFPIDKMERADLYDLAFRFLKAIKQTPLDQLRTQDLLAAAHLLRDQRHLEEAVKMYRDYIEQKLRREGKVDVEVLREVLAVSASGYGKYQEIEKYLSGLLARGGREKPERAEVYYLLGRLQLDEMNQPGKALTSLQSAKLALPRSENRELERQVWIALGDAHRAMAKTDEARAAYVKAQELPLPEGKRHDYDVSSYALTAEAYIRRGHLDEAREIIDEWESKFPTEKLVGYSTILKARVLASRGKRRDATREIEGFLATKPQGVFLQNALLELGDIYAQMGRTREARETYERLLNEFETQENREAVEEKLRQLRKK